MTTPFHSMTQENLMLIAPSVDTATTHLGGGVYVTTPWVMDDRKGYHFVGGVVSLHNTKKEKSYIKGRILEVINLGSDGFATNRVAIVFRQETGKINPARIRIRHSDTVTETLEQVRY